MIELGDFPDINAISSEDGSYYQLELSTGAGDYFLRIVDPAFQILLPAMRFRTEAGGGALPLIADELSHIPRSFGRLRGQVPPDIDMFMGLQDYIPSYLNLKVEVNKNTHPPAYRVLGLSDDDDEYPPSVFMDIQVGSDKRVILTQRSVSPKRQAQMTFLPATSRGRYPVVAAAFTNIVKRLVKASSM